MSVKQRSEVLMKNMRALLGKRIVMRLVIIGTGDYGAIAKEYFEKDYGIEVLGFAVEKRYKDREEFMGLKVVELEKIEEFFSPEICQAFVAIVYQGLNRSRTRIYKDLKKRGYNFANYISPHSFIGNGVVIGENSFVFENNTLQYNVQIGNNVVIWSGNHIGHSTVIHDNCYISSHVCISGHCKIGENSFLGVNSAIADDVSLAEDTVVAMGAAVNKSNDKVGVILGGVPAKELPINAYAKFGVE